MAIVKGKQKGRAISGEPITLRGENGSRKWRIRLILTD
jgi:hypothetical protein